MSGHSKWATIKHKKGAADKARGKVFNKLARQLEVAAREGGGDPSRTPSLRTIVQKAKAAQMTNDAIDRADQARRRRQRRRHLRSDHLRGLRARRRGAADRRAHRQPQPHRRRRAQHLLQARRLDGRARRGRLAVQPHAACCWCNGGDEDTVMMAALEAGADDVAADGDGVAGHLRPVDRVRRARRARRPPASRSSRPRARWCRA